MIFFSLHASFTWSSPSGLGAAVKYSVEIHQKNHTKALQTTKIVWRLSTAVYEVQHVKFIETAHSPIVFIINALAIRSSRFAI